MEGIGSAYIRGANTMMMLAFGVLSEEDFAIDIVQTAIKHLSDFDIRNLKLKRFLKYDCLRSLSNA